MFLVETLLQPVVRMLHQTKYPAPLSWTLTPSQTTPTICVHAAVGPSPPLSFTTKKLQNIMYTFAVIQEAKKASGIWIKKLKKKIDPRDSNSIPP